MSRYIVAIASSAAVLASFRSTLHNEPKRNFYEDEKDVVPVPGTVIPSTTSEAELLGSNSVVNGVTVRSAPQLESVFGSVRGSLYNTYVSAQNYLNQGKEKVYDAERKVTGTVSSLHNKSEDLLPNSIYVVIAGLSGNILARQRGILARTFLPLALGLASFKYFLPQTFSNTAGFAWKVEQRTVPELANGQVAVLEHAEKFKENIEKTAESSKGKLHNGVQAVRRKVSVLAGLNVDESVTKK